MSLDVYLNVCVHADNITHNLWEMAREAGIGEYLWYPGDVGIVSAEQLIEPLRKGLELLRADPGRFTKLNPKNGWGTYEDLLTFVQEYLLACEENPHADVSVW